MVTIGWSALTFAAVMATIPVVWIRRSPAVAEPIDEGLLLIEAGRMARTVDMSNPADAAAALGIKLQPGITHPSLPIPNSTKSRACLASRRAG